MAHVREDENARADTTLRKSLREGEESPAEIEGRIAHLQPTLQARLPEALHLLVRKMHCHVRLISMATVRKANLVNTGIHPLAHIG